MLVDGGLTIMSYHVMCRQSLGQPVLPSRVQRRPKLLVQLEQAMFQFLHLQDTFNQVGTFLLMKQQIIVTLTVRHNDIPFCQKGSIKFFSFL